MSNPSTIYANIFVDELIRSGLKHVCFVPGSRHTPLILAFAKHKHEIKIYSHLDERSASFFALGLALALDEPVAMVCTSGSAGANFFPAIIEAHQSRVPLIVLTADRPHELRQSGANQTIDQVKMFGDFVLWFYDAPLPEENPPAVALRNLRTLAARTVAKANGIRKGVVHINMPFRKPLEPTNGENNVALENPEKSELSPQIKAPRYTWDGIYSLDVDMLLNKIRTKTNGIIIAGTRNNVDLNRLLEVAEKYQMPIFVDFLQNPTLDIMSKWIVRGYETFLHSKLDIEKLDIVVRFGSLPISKQLSDYLAKNQPEYYVQVSNIGEWSDDSHMVDTLIQADETNIAMLLAFQEVQLLVNTDSMRKTRRYERITWQVIDHEIETGEYFDGGVVYDVVDLIPDESTLFGGNSLPVRHLDQFGKPTNKRIYAYANRGASGIDGNISTALGTGAARPDKPLVAIIGDITFYHDMNGLMAVHRCGVPITIVLLNNDGGGIFHRLPVSKHDPDFTNYFVTAHGLDYSHSAKLYGLDYVRADTRDEFRQAFTESVTNRASTIIEVRTNAIADLKRRNEIVAAVHARLKELDL